MKDVAIGIDFGGTKIKGILMDKEGIIYLTKISFTGDNISNLIELIKEIKNIASLKSMNPVALGLGSAGLVDHQKGIVHESANISFVRNFPMKCFIEETTGLETFLDNDVKMGALGEKIYGEGRDVRNFIFITLGTGIGGAIFIDGKLYRGADNLSGEIGHITLQERGIECGCGKKGCYESLASGKAILNNVLYGIKKKRKTILFDLVDGDENKINTSIIAEAARKGDRLSLEAFEMSAHYTGLVISYLINIFNPEKVIIGGGITETWDIIYPGIMSVSQLYSLDIPFQSARIVKSSLGLNAGVMGAAKLAFLKTRGEEI